VKTSASAEVVLREIRDGVATLTLNRPDRLNAWTPAMEDRYFGFLEEAGADPDVRVIVVTGAGKGFCPGVDMDTLEDIGAGGAFEHSGKPQTFPLTIPKPIIAAINGACAGLGLVVALMCDVRFCAENAKLTTAFSRRGLIAEHGVSWILPRLVGPARALDLLLSARVLRGREAAELGVVNRAVQDDQVLEVALEYARDLAANVSPASMATIKAQVYGDFERSLADTLERADRLMFESFSKPDFAEGVQSFVEQRPPRFAPLPGGVATT
jgi:enoyl-CoA hydratase/carnithine racemase